MVTITTGLTDGMLIFMVASGLTLILGVMGVVNFAHGGFFLVGAYLSFQFMGGKSLSVWLFLVLLVAASLATVVIGLLSERFLFRRLYALPGIITLLGTYALLLILEGGVQIIWGQSPRTQPQPNGLTDAITIGGANIPKYSILILIIGALTAIGLQLLVSKTPLGHQLTAVAEDRYVAGLLGINVNQVFALTFAVGIFLAGLGGGLAGPTLSMVPDIALTFILEAFAVVIIGGFGSIMGSLIAALALGLFHAFMVTHVPEIADFSLYILMAVVLVARPQGILGKQVIGDSGL